MLSRVWGACTCSMQASMLTCAKMRYMHACYANIDRFMYALSCSMCGCRPWHLTALVRKANKLLRNLVVAGATVDADADGQFIRRALRYEALQHAHHYCCKTCPSLLLQHARHYCCNMPVIIVSMMLCQKHTTF
jgi:hypothetical protein